MRSLLCLSLLAFLTVVGCANFTSVPPTPDLLSDTSFLTDQPCAAPCWYGLELDKSTKEEVYATITKLPFVEVDSINEQNMDWLRPGIRATYILWKCARSTSTSCGVAVIYEGKLKEISSGVTFDLTIERAIQKLGTPDYVEYDGIPQSGSLLILNYPQKGIAVRYTELGNRAVFNSLRNGKGVPPNTKVTQIYYQAEDVFRSRSCCFRISWPGFAK